MLVASDSIDDFDETAWMVQAAGDEPAQLPVVGWIGSVQTHLARSAVLRLGQQHPDLLGPDMQSLW